MFVLSLFLTLVVPYFFHIAINTLYIKNKVSSLIYTKTGIHVDPFLVSLRLFPKPGIILTDFIFTPDKRISFEISQLKFDMDLQSFFHGRMVIGQILLQSPKISFPTLNSQQFESSFLFQDFELKEKINKIFTFLPEDQENFKLIFKNAISPFFNTMDGSIQLSREKKNILFNASIKELALKTSDLPKISLDQYLDLDSIMLDQFKFSAMINTDFEIQGNVIGQDIIIRSSNNNLIFDSNTIDASFSFSNNTYQLDIKPLKIDYPNGVVSAHFFSDLTNKKSEIKFIGNNIHIDQVKKMFLAVFKNNQFVKDLFDILHNGISPEINVSFQTDDLNLLFNAKNLKLKGEIEKGEVKIPGTNIVASNIKGIAEIHNGILDINATRAMIESSVIKQGQLKLDLLGFKHVPFNGEFLLDADLSMVPKTLESLLPDTILAKELAKVHNITGRSNVRLNLSIPTDSNDLDVKIDSEDFSIRGNYDRIPGIISLERINFKYNSGVVYLNHINGTMTGFNIKDLKTSLDFKEEPEIVIHSGAGLISLDSAIPFLMSNKKIERILLPLKKGSGKIDIISIQLSGPVLKPEKWDYDISGNLNNLNLTTQLNQKQVENISCQYHISDNCFSLEKIFAKIENLSWLEPFMEKKHLESIRTPIDMANGRFQTDKNESTLNSDLQFPDGQKLQIELDGDSPKSLTLKKILLLDPGFSNALLLLPSGTDKILSNFSGILNTKTLNKLLIPESYLEKEINDFTEGEPVLIHTDKDSVTNIITKKLNFSSFFSSQKSFSMKNRLFSKNVVKFKTENLTIKNWIVKDIESEVSFKNDDVYIQLHNGHLCDLDIKGYINLENDRIYSGIAFKAHNKENIQNLLTCLLKKNDFMDGRYSLTGEIISDAAKNDFLNTLKGAFFFKAEEGRVYKLTLLSRILSLLNVSSFFKGSIPNITQKGFAYKTIFIEADIKDSIIYITKGIVDGNDMTIIFNGQIDLINDHIDLTCLVAPFKTVDLIIEKIPIISTLLSGNLVSVPVKATGKISDPAVVPLHPSAVGEGLINAMKNILKTPVKLLDKISDNEEQRDESTSGKK